jgi:hypothetical protein
MTPARALAAALTVTLAVANAGCVRREPETHAAAIDRATCRQRAEQVFQMQNPEDVYRSDTYATSTRDTPFTGQGLANVPSRGLSSQYERDQMFSDCLRDSAGNVGTSPAAPAPEETAPP